ncbi:MAG: D-cysteine desulfhydrase family protein, partial [Desulfuromonadales bacterium]|nr:D-cysteine desulfhydrase family protein [Desulfuromonadales bacterium]NIS40964.1 D-cysteine desulfhydrase family protein [Desulfuromonadales bacterium]
WGYIEACRELRADFALHDIEPGYIVSAAGSGGTLGGLIIGRQMYGLRAQMAAFNVCDDEAWFVEKIRGDMA